MIIFFTLFDLYVISTKSLIDLILSIFPSRMLVFSSESVFISNVSQSLVDSQYIFGKLLISLVSLFNIFLM